VNGTESFRPAVRNKAVDNLRLWAVGCLQLRPRLPDRSRSRSRIVAASGQLVAYDAATGNPRWIAKAGGESYSSPQLMTIGGVTQVLMVSGSGATGITPTDGKQLWQHPWRGFPIVQPALTADGDVLIVAGSDSGTRRVAVAHGPRGWTAEERWTSDGLKPYFNDFVVHKGHTFGFDARILACIDLTDGIRKWKGGRYGNGPARSAIRSGFAARAVGGGRARLGQRNPRSVHGSRAVQGDRGQDVEPPRARGRYAAGSQRPGDGRVPASRHWTLTRVALSHWTPYYTLGGGLIWTKLDVPEVPRIWTFQVVWGMGIKRITRRGPGLMLDFRNHHIS
jgi:hypothetical protein